MSPCCMNRKAYAHGLVCIVWLPTQNAMLIVFWSLVQCIEFECYILCPVCSLMQVISTADLIVVQEVRSADAAQTLLVELQK